MSFIHETIINSFIASFMIFVLIPLYIPIVINDINDVINENPIEFLCAAKDPKIQSAPILANKTIESNAPSHPSGGHRAK